MNGHIFLAGGGSPAQSVAVDRVFVSQCRRDRPLVYVPNALRATAEQSLVWLRSVMTPLGLTDIVLWDHLAPDRPPEAIGGIYIGGGDTLFLLDQLIASGFDAYLRAAVAAGVPIYGGSAGAIVLGETLATSRMAVDAGRGETAGLGLVSGYAIACHHAPEQDARLAALGGAIAMPIIAIGETGGVAYADGTLRSVGDGEIRLFQPDGTHATL